jgi:hypothetical protein
MHTHHEPVLRTPAHLLAIRDELMAREPIFHRPEFGTTRDDFAAMVVDDFWEVGASGRRYSRTYVLDELEKRHSALHEDVWEAKDFHCRQLGPSFYLLTYTLIEDAARVTRRATIWQRTEANWKIVYHQGTLVT